MFRQMLQNVFTRKNKFKKYTYTKKKQKTIFERMFQKIHFKD